MEVSKAPDLCTNEKSESNFAFEALLLVAPNWDLLYSEKALFSAHALCLQKGLFTVETYCAVLYFKNVI